MSGADDFSFDPDIEAKWEARREAEEAGWVAAHELLSLPEEVVKAALFQVAVDSPRLFNNARHGASKEALDIEDEVTRLRVRKAARHQFEREEGAQAERPAAINLTDFLAEPDEDVRYRVESLWPMEGRIVLAAQNKSGKTTMVGNLVRSLVDGDEFLGKFPVATVGRVVLIDDEMGTGQIRRWLRDQGIENTSAVDVIPLRGRVSSFNILDPDVRQEWASVIGPADVLIFDCLRPALDALGLSEDKDAGRFLEALDEFIAACSIPELLLVHHMGHSNERSRGDSRLEDWPDAKWKIVKQAADSEDPDGAFTSFFSAFGRDVDQSESRLAFDPDTRHLSINGGSRAHASRSQVENNVQNFVLDNPGCSGGAIEKGVGGDRNKVRAAIKTLEADGWLRLDRQGVGKSTLHFPSDPNARAAAEFSENDPEGPNVETPNPEIAENSGS